MSKSTGKNLKEFLINRDLFGHPVQLNFNLNGDSHKTLLGGILSIFLRMLYYTYMAYLLNKMYLFEDDRTYSFDYQVKDEDQLRKVSFFEQGVI